ncbi:hypothetical protein JRQ81_018263 [Phrynocephalus forsythii]|uniref:Uncharacterized protein n=1 Tax=Phrynocephalus forsythii TaxID=171643 RepID=A0A9Q1B0Q6_9SAUR|nr:hypothetical protein JRQ81_018263 [Phrynocephalus forsythii]
MQKTLDQHQRSNSSSGNSEAVRSMVAAAASEMAAAKAAAAGSGTGKETDESSRMSPAAAVAVVARAGVAVAATGLEGVVAGSRGGEEEAVASHPQPPSTSPQGHYRRTWSPYPFFNQFSSNWDPSNCPLIRRALKGWERQALKAPDNRKPITIDILLSITEQLEDICWSKYKSSLFRVTFTLAFYEAFQVGDLVANSQEDTKGRTILAKDITLEGDTACLILQSSKPNQKGLRANIRLRAQAIMAICPIHALRSFLHIHPPKKGPLLIHKNGHPLTRYQFVGVLKKALPRARHTLGGVWHTLLLHRGSIPCGSHGGFPATHPVHWEMEIRGLLDLHPPDPRTRINIFFSFSPYHSSGETGMDCRTRHSALGESLGCKIAYGSSSGTQNRCKYIMFGESEECDGTICYSLPGCRSRHVGPQTS